MLTRWFERGFENVFTGIMILDLRSVLGLLVLDLRVLGLFIPLLPPNQVDGESPGAKNKDRDDPNQAPKARGNSDQGFESRGRGSSRGGRVRR